MAVPAAKHQHQHNGQQGEQNADLLDQHHGAQRQADAEQACPIPRLKLPDARQRIAKAQGEGRINA